MEIIAETFANLHAIDLCRSYLDNIASMAWNLDATKQRQLRSQRRVDGVGRPKFGFHTDRDQRVLREVQHERIIGR